MIVFRLSRARYASDLSGKGAELSGGRWNSRGTPMLYCSESRALCTVEIAVHLPLNLLPVDYKIISLEIPDHLRILTLLSKDLPSGWNSIPPIAATRDAGDKFINEGRYVGMKVPSAIIKDEYNMLFNPGHKDFRLLTITSIDPFDFDKRLLKM
jgi:RES domain-containing protein